MPMLYSLPPQRGAFSRILSGVVLLAIVAISFFLGLFVFLIILGVGLVAGLVLYLRLRTLRRSLRQAPRPGRGGGVTLEGEYTVSKSPRDRDG